MTANAISNWIAIYAATGICCAFAMLFSVGTVAIEVYQERLCRGVIGWRSALLFAPKLWWRWQKRYLFSTPVTLIIVAWFGATLNWAT